MKALKQGNLGGFHLRWVTPEVAWRMDMRALSLGDRRNSRKTVAVRSIRNNEDLK